MNKIYKIRVLLLVVVLLSGCQQTRSYDYLMQHPAVLQKEYASCRGQSTAHCDEVVRAAEDFRTLIQQRSDNPELFGQQIMQAQQKGDKQKVRVLYAVVKATSAE